jgi:hypothetical protein
VHTASWQHNTCIQTPHILIKTNYWNGKLRCKLRYKNKLNVLNWIFRLLKRHEPKDRSWREAQRKEKMCSSVILVAWKIQNTDAVVIKVSIITSENKYCLMKQEKDASFRPPTRQRTFINPRAYSIVVLPISLRLNSTACSYSTSSTFMFGQAKACFTICFLSES